jgi:hypothetical protein
VTPALRLVLDEAGRRGRGRECWKTLASGVSNLLRRRSARVTVPLLTREQVADVRYTQRIGAAGRGRAGGRSGHPAFLPEPDGADGKPADL